MTPDTLREIGRALYGARFTAEFARALRVSDRTARRWVSGEEPAPDGIKWELRGLLCSRRKWLTILLDRLEK